MKKIAAAIILVMMCTVFLTCSSDEEELLTLTFSIEYVPEHFADDIKNCEVLILTGDDKKILERAVIPTQTKHSFSVQSPTEKITLVIIDSMHWNGLPPSLSIRVFRNVTPGNWRIPSAGIPFKEPLIGDGSSLSDYAVINYINMPDYDDSEFENKPVFSISNGGGAWNVVHENHSSAANYACTRQMPIDYTCLLMPSLGKYKLTDPTSTKLQIDLKEMKDAKKIVFGGLEKIGTTGMFGLVAYFSETRWIQTGASNPGWDLIYPEDDLIKKYELSLYGTGLNWTAFDYYCLLDKLPSSIELVDDSYYSLDRNGSDININFLKEGPTYYYLRFGGSGIDFTIYSPTDVTSTKPIEFLKSLNSSSYLQKRKIDELELEPTSLGLIRINPMDYQAYWNYVLTPGKLKAKSIKEVSSYFYDFRQ